MQTDAHRQYVDDTIRLVRTLVIKSASVAKTINDGLIEAYGEAAVDTLRPETWKYYLNLAGKPHSTNTTMVITSLDTMGEIEFTKENLEIHTETAIGYRVGTRFYEALLARYPEQDSLIHGILYPVDIDKAIAAEDGTILNYDTSLIETYEYTLLRDIEGWIKRYMSRWDVKSYGLSNDLYVPAFFAVMGLNLVPNILNMRLNRCHTVEAHSYHVRNYLASHGKLDKYYPYMTRQQAMWLYRNIRYIDRNAGKQTTFAALVENMLTKRYIPLSEYSVRQLNVFDPSYLPEIAVRQKPINDQYNVASISYDDIETLYSREKELVPGNEEYLKANSDDITQSFKLANTSVTQTKALVSEMVDYTDAVPVPFTNLSIGEWCQLSASGKYNAVVSFQDPKTSEERLLTAKDAFIYYYYLGLCTYGKEPTVVPPYLGYNITKYPKPSVDDILKVAPTKVYKGLREIAQSILDRRPEAIQTRSRKAFYRHCNALFDAWYVDWFVESKIQDGMVHAVVKNMANATREHRVIELAPPNTEMRVWLQSKNLPAFDFTLDQAETLMLTIYRNAIGSDMDDTKLRANIQKAMIEIVKQLSSYSIQLVSSINSSPIRILNPASQRIIDYKERTETEWNTSGRVDIVSVSISEDRRYVLELPMEIVPDAVVSSDTWKINLHSKNKVSSDTVEKIEFEVVAPANAMSLSYPGMKVVNMVRHGCIGMESYDGLTEDQLLQIKSVYN